MCNHAPGKYSISGNEASMLRRPYFTDEIFNNAFSMDQSGRPSVGVRIDPQEFAQVNACIAICYHSVNVREAYKGIRFRVHVHKHSSLDMDYELFAKNLQVPCNNLYSLKFYDYKDDEVLEREIDLGIVEDSDDYIDMHVHLPIVSYQHHTLSWPPRSTIENQAIHHTEFNGDRLIVAMPFDVREILLESMMSDYNVMPLVGICPYNNIAFRLSYGDTPRVMVPKYTYSLESRYNSVIDKVLYSKDREGNCRACCLLSLYRSGQIAPLFTSPK